MVNNANDFFYIGIDAGGTKTFFTLYDKNDVLVNEYKTPGASLKRGAAYAYEMIMTGIRYLCEKKHIHFKQIYLGIGIAGFELTEERLALQNLLAQHDFLKMAILSDAHSACLAAHQGHDGICMIIGTGIIAWQCSQNQFFRAGGWGFPHDDIGSGAWMGMRALRYYFQAHDQRIRACTLTESIFQHFSRNHEALIKFANQAQAAEYASIVPLIIQQAKHQNQRAIFLLTQSAKQVTILLKALHKQSRSILPWTLIGGLSEIILPFVDKSVLSTYRAPLDSPEKGAIYYLKNHS